MVRFKTIIHIFILSYILILGGCAGKVAPIAAPSPEVPASFSQSGTARLDAKWWHAFEDESLNDLIDRALSDNFTLKSSWARLTQANAVYNKNRAGLFPTLDMSATGSQSVGSSNGTSTTAATVNLGLSAAYEIDLWGKINSETEAARLDMVATTADLDAAAMTLTAEVASTWYRLIRLSASLKLYDQQIETNTKALALINAQFKTGQVPLADVLQQRQLIETQQGEKVQLLSEKEQTEHSLDILLGQLPGSRKWQMPDHVSELPELPATGIPAELVRLRPDIRSSYLALLAADQRVAVAVSEQYPSLRLSLSLETINSSSALIFNDYFSSILAGIAAPLLDGGLREAEVERTRGAAVERLYNYSQTVITAVREVEDALLIEGRQQQYIESLQGQLELATRTMDQVKERYLKGLEDYQRVLTALTSLQALQQKLVSARTDLLLNRVELCRALGTGWAYSDTVQGS